MKWIFNAMNMFKSLKENNRMLLPYYENCIAVINLPTKHILINLKTITREYNDYKEKEFINQIGVIMSHEVIHEAIKKQTGSNEISCMWDNIAYDLEEYQ
jgi:hypothetical protein